ncbi:putative disease resistance protein RGA3 [Cornus florida]|uniref:putative disease resistance protein RGA3 n=1 Tax=Cornus florida TaxID=4283 RepID=UPI0028996101|nr:putative disease resistance protein RGA3 [Cornus florida]XP_059645019.1 putative disease resistance protein RGA3 [Cornus florida]XP_059645020.1 putative disease resistance protein RGA3 [Cornus florida]XP_059645021.1 putative disease resistance protein RGA3 [Cornus florida]XP_059645022.1 putative disease resistance protein RGA3 [Cornus florida]
MPNAKYRQEKSVFERVVCTFKRLRVLDMSSSGMHTVPSGISELRHLRYLDLSFNYLSCLPNSITKLQNLQTLKLTYSNFKELPRDARNLVSLRHLDLDNCNDLTDMPRGFGQLTSLRTLTRFIVGTCSTLSELKDLNNLRGQLEIDFQLEIGLPEGQPRRTSKEAEEANLKGKEYLQSLILGFGCYSDNKKGGLEELLLEGLRPHETLKKLFIKGYGGVRLPTWMSFLRNLVEMKLYYCNGCKHLPKIEQLPFLRTLHLESLDSIEYIDDNYSCSTSTGGGNEDEESLISSSFPSSSLSTTTFFPSLKYLQLEKMYNLKGWWRSKVAAEEDEQEQSTVNINQEEQQLSLLPSFPCLVESQMKRCPKLASMPLQPVVVKLQFWQVNEKVVRQQFSLVTFSNLEDLKICDIEDLVNLPEEAFQHLTSLRKLKICNCHSLTSLSRGMRHLTALHSLEFYHFQELDLSDGDDNGMHFQGLTNLTSLHIQGIPKLESLPAGLQHIATLQSLSISECYNLKSLPEWIGNHTSLQHLSIYMSDKLTSLPEGMRRLTALQQLKIEFCSTELYHRCQKETGEDWPKIAHIPNVDI